MRLRRITGLVLLQLSAFVLASLLICAAPDVHILLLRIQGAAQRVGLSQEEVATIARTMVRVMIGGEPQLLRAWFTAEEVLHMQDVQDLFGKGVWVFTVLFTPGVWLYLPTRKLHKSQRAFCARWALALSLLLPAAIAVAFALDFAGVFLWLHRLAFPGNTLWLMDPRIHRMVVLYTEEFFIAAVGLIGLLCVVSLVPLLCSCRRPKE